jgi:UDP-N-acetylmuramoylalanine--D-glutamate ligase
MLTVELGGVRHALVPADELAIKGEHNASNALAAASVALALGCTDEQVRAGLLSFQPLEHRIEPCGTVAGISFYNDSKATNVDATLKALAAFAPARPIVLLGGDDKGTDLAELVAQAEAHCKAVICFGEAGPRFLAAFADSALPHLPAGKMADALDVAITQAEPGDIICLSPACASFDEFSGFEERGRVFKQLVATRSQERGV